VAGTLRKIVMALVGRQELNRVREVAGRIID
jgi:hypothetical protein